MDSITIFPKALRGSVTVPPSKSIAHRALICAALSDSDSVIDNIALSDDIVATVNAMKNVGADIKIECGRAIVRGAAVSSNSKPVIDCNESGSTLRFLIPVVMTLFSEARFSGRGRLGKRPLDIYYDIFKKQGISYRVCENPFEVEISGRLHHGIFEVPGNVSSQFITGLLLALPLADGNSEIIVTDTLESKGYVDLTLSVMETFGVKVKNDGYEHFYINGNQKYKGCRYTVEGDYSQAAFFEVANYIGNKIDILGTNPHSLQGDRQILDIIEALKETDSEKTVVIDGSQCPDIIPIAAVAACLRKGSARIEKVGRLRLKESDRLEAVATELTKMGADICADGDALVINGVEHFSSCTAQSHNDHRIAMMLAIAATASSGSVTINDYKCVSKSYPDFFDVYKSLGGDVFEQHMGE